MISTMLLEREAKQEVISALKRSPVVAILGPRQSGKTTLAKSVLGSGPNVLYLDLERHSDLAKLEDAETFLVSHQDKLVCLDEAQLKPDLFPLLRALIDDGRRAGRFLILGSASPRFLRQSSESLAGRISHIYLTPFHLRELKKTDKSLKTWKKPLWRGGFPQSYLAPDDEQSFFWRENYIQTFVERDLRQFGINVNSQEMRRLWMMCCHSHGQVVNYSKLGQSLDVTYQTIKRHIDVFEETFMMRRLLPFMVNTKKRLVKSPKLYIRDSGLLVCLLGLDSFDKLYSHPAYGSCWEGFAIENILAMLQPSNIYGFSRTRKGEEIDLVLEHRRKLLGFEFKASSAPRLNSGNKAAAKMLGLDRLFVVVPEGDSYPLKGDGIDVLVTPLDQVENHLFAE